MDDHNRVRFDSIFMDDQVKSLVNHQLTNNHSMSIKLLALTHYRREQLSRPIDIDAHKEKMKTLSELQGLQTIRNQINRNTRHNIQLYS